MKLSKFLFFILVLILSCQDQYEVCIISENTSDYFIYDCAIGTEGNSAIWSFDQNLIFCGNRPPNELRTFKISPNGSILWMKSIVRKSSNAQGIVESPDQNLFVCGTSTINNGSFNEILLVKMSMNGDSLWTKTFGTEISTYGRRIILTNDQNVLIAGQTDGPVRNIVIIKVTFDGELLWSKTFTSNNHDSPSDLIETMDGEYVITGTRITEDKYVNLLLIRFDKDGNILWDNEYSGGPASLRGGSTIELVNGDLIICVDYEEDPKEPLLSSSFLMIVKTDKKGRILWDKKYDDTSFGTAQCIRINQDGSYTISGFTNGSEFSGTPQIAKINANGKMLWCEEYTEIKNGSGVNLLKDIDDNNIIIGRVNGTSPSDVFMTKISNH